MKHVSKLGLAMLVLALAYACKQGEAKTEESSIGISADSTAVISSSAAVEKNTSNRKFIRTADLKFKVKDVAKSTYAIENVVTKFGGFVTFTDLKSTINERAETRVSEDSILETTKYTVDNSIVLRVPNTQLDTVLKSLVKQIDFLDSRLIKADDVALQLLANKLSQKRLTVHQNRLAKGIDEKGKKLNDITNSEDHLLNRTAENDAAAVDNLSLEDKVNYSTMTLYIYQREIVKYELIKSEKNINKYRPHLGLQIWDGLKTGWFMLESIISFIVQLWGIFLIILILFLGYKKFNKREN